MEIDDSTSLMFFTYFMVDWTKVSTSPSATKCFTCGGDMQVVEPVTDKKGIVFDGVVCHHCKRVLWARRSR